jgi:hypothetical protein
MGIIITDRSGEKKKERCVLAIVTISKYEQCRTNDTPDWVFVA